jgi:hypothetical protein
MTENHTRGETHGCIVCGKLYELYVVYGSDGSFVDCKVMSAGGRCVPNAQRPLVACDSHADSEVAAAVKRIYGTPPEEDD